MSGPVVVGVDGSPSSLTAVEVAVREADRRGVGVRLTYALGWPSGVPAGVPPWDPGGGYQEALNGTLAEARHRASGIAPRVEVTNEVLFGAPAAVLELSSAYASLTVVDDGRPNGGKRVGALPHESVSGRLVRHGPCPVLVVRGRQDPTGPVLVALNSSAGARRATELAFAEPSSRRVPGPSSSWSPSAARQAW
ncbi:universal stress protein [Streptomyces sp. NPDC048484]|uniref:universal stress protein n=1 Tax=Streptomyces sp. NPDC048484 TaxID=3155146 RepID=UPI003432DA3B